MCCNQAVPLPDQDNHRFGLLIQKLNEAGLPNQGDATAYISSSEDLGDGTKVDGYLDELCRKFGEMDKHGRHCLTSLDFGDSLAKNPSVAQLTQGEPTAAALGDADKVDYRIQASRCSRGRVWSFTIRRQGGDKYPSAPDFETWMNNEIYSKYYKDDRPSYKPSRFHLFTPNGSPALASIAEISRSLFRLIINGEGSHPSGLVLLTGETNCGKSLIARGLIHEFLTSLKGVGRNPHLVTYEDPIEEWFFPGDLLKETAGRSGRRIDYTPRQKGADCGSLKECTTAALRQTPSVLF